MIRLLILLITCFFTTTDVSSQSIESQLFEELQGSFKAEGEDLNKVLDAYEAVLVENKILKDTSAFSRRLFTHLVGQSEELGRILPMNEAALEFQLAHSMDHMERSILAVMARDSNAFSESSLAKVFDAMYSNDPKERTYQNNVRNALGILTSEDWEHPFYRALTLFLSANFSDLRYETSDQIYESANDYKKLSNKLVFEGRNILDIQKNAAGHILIKTYHISDPAAIKDFVIRFYTMNRSLSQEEVKENIKNDSYEGWNYPFYSHLDLESINSEIDDQRELMISEVGKEYPDWIEFRRLNIKEEYWINCRRFLEISNANNLKIIHPHAHVRLVTYRGDSINDISEELNAITLAVTQLRNDEALNVFGESYEVILNRQNFFLNDALKLRYLENQFPLIIMVNPSRRGHSQPPPTDEMVLPPPVYATPPPTDEIRTPPPPKVKGN
ncbi:MAG: hypothetical protein ACFHU9_12870 [Fluviicola sp.]